MGIHIVVETIVILLFLELNFQEQQHLIPVALHQGNLQYLYGADGAGTISLTGLAQGVTLSNGSSVALTTSNNSIIAKDTSGNLVFQIQLTPATGKMGILSISKHQNRRWNFRKN